MRACMDSCACIIINYVQLLQILINTVRVSGVSG